MKKWIAMLLTVACMMSVGTAYAAKSVTMYAKDGRTVSVWDYEVDEYRAEGWQLLVEMYSVDGRTLLVPEWEVNDYKNVGWYAKPPVKMFAADGRTLYVSGDEVALYETLGWSTKKTVYAADGRSIQIPENEIDAYKAAGWYTQPPVVMYAVDGRTVFVSVEEVEAYKNVGWYTQPPVVMYAADGRTLFVSGDEIEVYKNVGWYTQPPVSLYAADGRTLVVSGDEVELYISLGWYKEPMCYVYSADGRAQIIKSSDLGAWQKQGWYASKSQAVNSGKMNEINRKVAAGNYGEAMNLCETYMKDAGKDSSVYSMFDNKRYEIMDKWRAAAKQPVVIEHSYVHSHYGIKEANFVFRNISHKTIVSIDLEFYCYDVYGNRLNYYNYGSAKFSGWTTYREDLRTLEQETWVWDLYGYDRTDSVRYAKITKVAFADGTVWSR